MGHLGRHGQVGQRPMDPFPCIMIVPFKNKAKQIRNMWLRMIDAIEILEVTMQEIEKKPLMRRTNYTPQSITKPLVQS